ncbi:DUF2207 domain-containing protein [Patescibacteria group bacterium]|nr:DUF2207 domain-containing protein [Patescibacteria group bacterium]
MRFCKKRLFFLLVLFTCGVGLTATARAKSFYYPRIDVLAQMNADGSVDFTESRTYDFDGSFSWATRSIPEYITRQGLVYQTTVQDFMVTENGKELSATSYRQNNMFEARWTYEARDEQRTFSLSYTITDVITEYSDVAEFYWQLIEPDRSEKVSNVLLTVKLPRLADSKDEIKVFGHGPLSGVVDIIDSQTVRLTADNVSANQFVELRVLFPQEMVAGRYSSLRTLESILEEERIYVEETVARLKRQQLIGRIILFALLGYVPLSITVWLVMWYRSWKKVGKDYQTPDVPKHSFELPSDLPPVLVQSLIGQAGKPDPKAFTATIFDLARRGFIKIDSRAKAQSGLFGSRTKYINRLKLTKEVGEMRLFEREVLDFLRWRIPDPYEWYDFDELKKWLKRHPQKFQQWFQGWQKQVVSEAKKLGFMEAEGEKAYARFWVFAIICALGFVNIPLIILAAMMNPYLKRRTREWQKECDLWKSVKCFLDEFSNFKELPPEAYKLWESYLVFGILFGNAEKIIKLLPVILRDDRAVHAAWYSGVGFESGMVNAASISNMTSAISGFSSALTSAAHYSSGSGGGVSGGGGGGGGGGGSGAG